MAICRGALSGQAVCPSLVERGKRIASLFRCFTVSLEGHLMRDIVGAELSSYSPEDQAFFRFWYAHMTDDLMQPPLANVRHSVARYIWDAAILATTAAVPVGEVKPVAEVRESQPINPSGETVKAAFLMDKSLPAGTLLYTTQPAPIEGWRMVPVEATREMCKAAVIYANGNAVYKNVPEAALKIEEGIYGEAYEAMLSASPTPSDAGGDARDAARYRWLARKVSAHGICDGWQFGFPTALTLPAPALAMRDPGSALGQAIDAAMAQQGGEAG